MKKIEFAFLTTALIVGLAACGNAETADNGAEDSTAETSAGAAANVGLDASTSDAMSIDVAAGGIEPMAESMQDTPEDPASTEPAAQ